VLSSPDGSAPPPYGINRRSRATLMRFRGQSSSGEVWSECIEVPVITSTKRTAPDKSDKGRRAHNNYYYYYNYYYYWFILITTTIAVLHTPFSLSRTFHIRQIRWWSRAKQPKFHPLKPRRCRLRVSSRNLSRITQVSRNLNLYHHLYRFRRAVIVF
jgi:hypothetical protein